MTKDFFVRQFGGFEGPITQMLTLMPEDKLDWSPAPDTLTLRALAAHLIFSVRRHADSIVSGEWVPEPADEAGGAGQTLEQLREGVVAAFRDAKSRLEGLSEKDFASRQDRFEANGRLIMAGTPEELAVWNVLRHLANHTMQLFWYLKQSGINVDTGTLYFGLPPGKLSTRAADRQNTAASG